MEKGYVRRLAGLVVVIASGLIWLLALIGGLALALLFVPIRIRIGGQLDSHSGPGYAINLDWAFGLAGVGKAAGRRWQIFILGRGVMRLPESEKKTKKKKTEEKKKRPWSLAGVAKDHFRTMTGIFDRLTRAVFLKGRLIGRIGLSDPADTAKVGALCRMVDRSSRRFKMQLACDYDEEVIQLEAAAQATLILGYLGLAAGLLLFQKKTRMMLHAMRHA